MGNDFTLCAAFGTGAMEKEIHEVTVKIVDCERSLHSYTKAS